jgi:CelD/BcsL family acetyltransferase involved in cellulose biosynthesis
MNRLAVEEIADPGSLLALQPEWWELWRRSAAATPFQAPAWLVPWWEAFAPGELCVVTVRMSGRLVALAPLYLEVGTRGHRLLPIGISVSDYHDVLLDDAVPGAADVLMQAIAQSRTRWDACELTELAPGAMAAGLACPRDCEETADAVSACPVLALPDSVEALRRTLSPRRRRALRMAEHRAERRGGIAITPGDTANCREMLEHLIRLHGTRWESRGEAGVLADERVQRFHEAALPQMMAAGLARCYALAIGGEVAAVYYGFMQRQCAYGYLTGFDPAYAFESPGALMLAHVLKQAVAEGAREFHFLRGRESYKYDWGAVDRWNRRRVFRRSAAYARAS